MTNYSINLGKLELCEVLIGEGFYVEAQSGKYIVEVNEKKECEISRAKGFFARTKKFKIFNNHKGERMNLAELCDTQIEIDEEKNQVVLKNGEHLHIIPICGRLAC